MSFTFDRKPFIYVVVVPEQGKEFAPLLCTLASLSKGFCIAEHDQRIAGPRKEDIETLG
jgi:hypothetical protein